MINEIIINKGIHNNIDVMENTLESFKEAFIKGYSVKTKVQILKDNTFVLLEDDALGRVLKLKDTLKSVSYEDLEYISKYEILKLKKMLELINDKIVVLEVSNYSNKILKNLLKEINGYQNNILILSKDLKILKFFRKNNFNVILFIEKNNKRLINSFFKPDKYCIENDLFDRKVIKKLREGFEVIGFDRIKTDDLRTLSMIFDKIIVDI